MSSGLAEEIEALQAKVEARRIVISHLTGDVAEALEQVRGAMTIRDGADAAELADIIHRTYREAGNVEAELVRHRYAAA